MVFISNGLKGVEDRTGREHLDSQTQESRNLPNCEEIHHLLSLNNFKLLCSLSCIKRGMGLKSEWAYFKSLIEKGAGRIKEVGLIEP